MRSNLNIGVSAKFHNRSPAFYGEAKRHIQYMETSIASWVAGNKALPLMIPSESADSDLPTKTLDVVGFAKELDGLVLQGGVDVHPSFYGGEVKEGDSHPYDIVRDRYELALIKAFIQEKKPILGICRGLQLLNVYFGGSLYNDLETKGFSKHLDKNTENMHSHEIEIKEGGVLNNIYASQHSKVISIHHQGIDQLGSDLFIEATSTDDALIEAVSSVDEGRFILAVQWHPELHIKRNSDFLDADRLMQTFINVARNRKFYGDFATKRKKPVKFSSSQSLSLGTELELQLVNKKTFDLQASAPEIIQAVSNETKKIKSEIFQSMIEIETDICFSATEIEKDLIETSRILAREADSRDLLIGSTGTHPFGKYRDRILTPDERYSQLIDSKQWIARRISIFGLHCHVGVKNPEQGIELYRLYLSLAPLFLGLSASSPFFQSEQTGLKSVRSTFFESMPSGGHPPILNSWNEFEGLISKMIKSKSITNHKDLWWDVRPSLNFGTIEIRICDSMPTIKENAALIALIHLLGHSYLNFKEYKKWPALSEWSYRENKWRALRNGLDFDFIINEDGNSCQAKEFLLTLLEELKPVVEELQYEEYVSVIKEKMLIKSPADRSLEVYQKNNDLTQVVQEYCEEFRKGLA